MKPYWIALPVASLFLGYFALAPRFVSIVPDQGVMPTNAALEISLSPVGVAAAGLQASTGDMLSAMSEAGGQYTQLQIKRQSLTDAVASVNSLSQSLSIHPGDAEIQAQYDAAVAQVQQLRSDIESLRLTIFGEVTSGLAPEKVQLLQTYGQNQGRPVPAEFRVKVRPEDQWHAIELALIAERRAHRLNSDLSQADAALLAGVRAEPDVITAKMNIDAGAASVIQAFSAAGAMPSGNH